MKFVDSQYADILWMEDFDNMDSETIDLEADDDADYVSEEEAKAVFPNIAQYHFRLHPYKYVIQTLKEVEVNFFQYSCAILDINMFQGFAFQGMNAAEEYEAIKKILNDVNVHVREDYEEFKKNAGYYVYLYLLQRGMPSRRIAILTGNKGKKENSTGKWEAVFHAAGLKPPMAFDKESELQNLTVWLEKTLDTPHRLRSCMVIMSRYLLDAVEKREKEKEENKAKYVGRAFLEKGNGRNQQVEQQQDEAKVSTQYKVKEDFFENAKLMLQSIQNMPLRLPENKEHDFFKLWIWQVAQPWESTAKVKPYWLDKNYQSFWKTMITTRNWLAHNVLESGIKELTTEAFLFGIGMRGMFNLRELLDSGETGKYEEYEAWENELLSIIQNTPRPFNRDELHSLVLRSCYEFHTRETKTSYKTNKLKSGEFTRDVCNLIDDLGQKKNGYECYETDLLRDFLHGLARLSANFQHNSQPQPKLENKYANIDELQLTISPDCRSLNEYNVYISPKFYGTKNQADVNANREWDYVVRILGLIERELDQPKQ